jgi:hypothetical protein
MATTLAKLLLQFGATLDCATVEGGVNDGYALAIEWQAAEVVTLTDAAVAPQNEAVAWTRIEVLRPAPVADALNLAWAPVDASGKLSCVMKTWTQNGTLTLAGGPAISTDTGHVMQPYFTQPTTSLGPPQFATAGPFDTQLVIVPGEGPLPQHRVVVSGRLDDSGQPSSSDPPLSGRYTGCFSRGDAGEVHLGGQLLSDVLDAAGAPLDCGTTEQATTFDGYTLEVHWEATSVVQVTIPFP